MARAAPVHTAGTLPPQTAGSHEGAQAPGRLASQVTRVVAGRVASIVKLEVARPAQSAESLHRGLNGPFNGATPHTPAPGAPEAGAGAFGQLAGTLTRHRPAGAKGARQ